MSVTLTDEQYLALLLQAREKGGSGRRRLSLSGCLVWLACGVIFVGTLAVMLPQIAAIYPVPVLSAMFVTPQIVVGTPLPTARQVQQQPMIGAPVPAGAPAWPTLTPEPPGPTATPEPTPDVAPIMAQPNLVPSKPGDNPGFSCGVEPGMDPNATCDPDEGAQSLSVPNVGERASDKAGPGGGE